MKLKNYHCLLRFEVQVTEHCNLNCNNCMHYAPLAPKEFLDVEQYKNDCKRLSKLFYSEVEWIRLMGGEPLLHPRINDLMRISRENFKYGRILIVTNGILLSKMEQEFWDTCRMYDIEIMPTEYPINLDYDDMREMAQKQNVKFVFFGNKGKMWRFPLDINGRQNPEKNFEQCEWANRCNTLRNGKLYTCSTVAHVHHLEKYFEFCINDESPRNYVDIYAVDSAEEIQRRLAMPIPFCRYCDFAHVSEYEDNWHVSTKTPYEWINFHFTEYDYQYLREAEEVYIYGAGNWGQETYYRLRKKGIKVEAFIVTSKENNVDVFEGVQVREIAEVSVINKNACVILAINGSAKKEIQNVLYKKGFLNIIPIMSM